MRRAAGRVLAAAGRVGPLRVLLGAAGGACVVAGTALALAPLLSGHYRALVSLAAWLGLGLAVHDGVLAPLTLAVSALAARLTPSWARGPLVVAGVVTGALVLLWLPVQLSPAAGQVPGLLDRPYTRGLLIALGAVAAGTVGLLTASRARRPAPGSGPGRAGPGPAAR